jgi:hypothetical protein
MKRMKAKNQQMAPSANKTIFDNFTPFIKITKYIVYISPMRKLLSILLLVIPVTVVAQFKITGKVLDSTDKRSVPGATVFLANASVGTATAVDGTFTLDNVHGGQYELVVTMVGYASFRKTILVNENINLPDIIVSSKSIALNEVKVRPDPNWARNYEAFRLEFLTTQQNAKY